MDHTTRRDGEALLESLSAEERAELETRHHVRSGAHVLWIEPDGRVRREKLLNAYYIRTAKGVFRVSRISKEVVEV